MGIKPPLELPLMVEPLFEVRGHLLQRAPGFRGVFDEPREYPLLTALERCQVLQHSQGGADRAD